jgi:flavin-dependent dehydrogenase
VLLVERARAVGVEILQPAKVQSVRGAPGRFECEIAVKRDRHPSSLARVRPSLAIRASIVIDAHGSWESDPDHAIPTPARTRADLFGFKASFRHAMLPTGFLPVLSFRGGYGGMVIAEDGRLTLACCIRRDALRECRARSPGTSAGAAIEHYLRASCPGVHEALGSAQRSGQWLSVGPLRPGIRIGKRLGPLLVGNAAGEIHPLIGEGINMALQSAFLLTSQILKHRGSAITASRYRNIHRDYGAAWHTAFAQRLRLAALFAHLAMRPAPSAVATGLLLRWPRMLTRAAHWAGKARNPTLPPVLCEGTP